MSAGGRWGMGGPGITRSDLLVIDKIALAPLVRSSLKVMASDTLRARGKRPFVFANMKTARGLERIIAFIERDRRIRVSTYAICAVYLRRAGYEISCGNQWMTVG